MIAIEFSDKNPASNLIAKALLDKYQFRRISESEWELEEGICKKKVCLINCKSESILEVEDFIDGAETIIVLSTHKSKINQKIMTCHYPGNWSKAEMKGKERTLTIANANLLKNLSIEINKESQKIGWDFSLEADHHGPTGLSPMIFVEIGSTEKEWRDERAAKSMADAVINAICREEKYVTVAVFGGGHYPKAFNKIQLEGEYAIGHIAPKFVLDSMDEEMFRQAIEKNVDRVSKILIAKDETSAKQREKIKEFATKSELEVETV